MAEEFPVDAEHLAQIRAVMTSGGWIAATLERFHPRKASDAALLEHVHGFHLLRIGELTRIRGRDQQGAFTAP